jgi:hypothetical protein
MTREEAIKELQESHDMMRSYDIDSSESRLMTALNMAIKALEQEPCIQEKQANADKIDAVYIDGFKAGYSQARFDLEQEPKYCDRNICIKNEYNGISCDECEVTKSQEPCEDAISRQAAIDLVSTMYLGNDSNSSYRVDGDTGDTLVGKFQVMDGLSDLPSVTPQPKTGWIPMTTRPMTEQEREHYREWFDVDEGMIFDCELPEDGQEVLVSYGGYVCVDTFCRDDGCYFEGVDIDGVEAWMPLPAPFKPQESEEISDTNMKMWEEIFKAERSDKE